MKKKKKKMKKRRENKALSAWLLSPRLTGVIRTAAACGGRRLIGRATGEIKALVVGRGEGRVAAAGNKNNNARDETEAIPAFIIVSKTKSFSHLMKGGSKTLPRTHTHTHTHTSSAIITSGACSSDFLHTSFSGRQSARVREFSRLKTQPFTSVDVIYAKPVVLKLWYAGSLGYLLARE
ncbi:hypothetical protein JOB18_011989 [Solea senegalensis]|uniref:Uncharacterized protein n=1 Tax=Solea senegalensis TaxID=28829 RepID=A0AAV6QRS8_SOLSE|nr:hypothetical protein JOB18_011989 [Solea senegalensis]